MSPRVLAFILFFVLAINVGFAAMFVLRGAWPIAPFMGADVALLGWAFRSSRVAARAFQRVKVTPSELLIVDHAPRGAEREMSLNPYWVRVSLMGEEDTPRRLTLSSHGKSVQVGTFLGPRERLHFAQALRSALGAAKAWRPASAGP